MFVIQKQKQPNKFVNIYPKRKCKGKAQYRVTFKYKTNFSGNEIFSAVPENFSFDVVDPNKPIEAGDLVRYMPKKKHQNSERLARVTKVRRRRRNDSTGQATNNQYHLFFIRAPDFNGNKIKRMKTSDVSELKLVPELEAFICEKDFIEGNIIVRYQNAKTRTKELKRRKRTLKKEYKIQATLFLKMVNLRIPNLKMILFQIK